MDPLRILMEYVLKLSILFQYILGGALLYALSLQHQFQCFRSGSGHYQLCLFPDEYCDDRYSECRPCSTDICDKLHTKDMDFPLQCVYKCSTGPESKESSVPDFIQDNANTWFIISLVSSVFLLVIFFGALWIKIKKKKRSEPEDLPLMMQDNAKNCSTTYGEQKLKNVNPTETSNHGDIKTELVTTKDIVSNDNTNAKQMGSSVKPD